MGTGACVVGRDGPGAIGQNVMPGHVAARRQSHIAGSSPKSPATGIGLLRAFACWQRSRNVASGLNRDVPAAGGADAAQAGVHRVTDAG